MKEIYIPMSCRVLTAGHIKVLEKLNKLGFVTIGLLTAKAMEGYKEEIVPYEDRHYILETVAMALGNIDVIPQDSLDPTENLKKTKYHAFASGDGFEEVEEKAIKRFRLEKIDVQLYREKKGQKLYSSSKILCRKK